MDELRIGKDVEGSDSGQFKVISWHLLGAGENYETPQ
jgi:hypothetical protein